MKKRSRKEDLKLKLEKIRRLRQQGGSNRDIAEKIGICEGTLQYHLRSMKLTHAPKTLTERQLALIKRLRGQKVSYKDIAKKVGVPYKNLYYNAKKVGATRKKRILPKKQISTYIKKAVRQKKYTQNSQARK